jgi:hypothetical protein
MKFGNSTKVLFKQSKFFALAAAFALVSCKGEEGEIGPKGANGETGATGAQGLAGASYDKVFENGFMKGTITGKRKDGTAFSEPFEYKFASGNASFDPLSATEHSIPLQRFKTMGSGYNDLLEMRLTVTNKDQASATAKFTSAYTKFTKELPNRNLFAVEAGPSFIAREITLPMSRANNVNYKLVDNGLSLQYYNDQISGQAYYYVKDTDGNTIFFNNMWTYDATVSAYYVEFRHIMSNEGVKSTASAKWGNMRIYDELGNNANTRIFRTSTGTNLSEKINVPADTQEITNLSYNSSSGQLTFDFKLVISEYRGFDRSYDGFNKKNTTMNPLEIKGSFSGMVYNSLVMRKGFE